MFHSSINTRAARPVTFGRGASIIRARGEDTLSLDALRSAVPAIFAEAPHESRSEKFVAIPTARILQSLITEGFQIVEARQGGSRDAGKRDYTKHRVRLRHPLAPSEMRLGGLYPEIVLTNGNDGTSAYWLEAGLFRLVCLNGMMVQDAQFQTQRVAHRGRADQVVDDVIEASFTVVRDMPAVIDQAGTMDALRLTRDEQVAFGRAALLTRWSGEDETPPIEARDLMRPRRHADTDTTLWNALNVAQEGLIRGGQYYRSEPTEANPRGQQRRVGEVKGIDQDRNINRAIWALGQEMARLKAAA